MQAQPKALVAISNDDTSVTSITERHHYSPLVFFATEPIILPALDPEDTDYNRHRRVRPPRSYSLPCQNTEKGKRVLLSLEVAYSRAEWPFQRERDRQAQYPIDAWPSPLRQCQEQWHWHECHEVQAHGQSPASWLSARLWSPCTA